MCALPREAQPLNLMHYNYSKKKHHVGNLRDKKIIRKDTSIILGLKLMRLKLPCGALDLSIARRFTKTYCLRS